MAETTYYYWEQYTYWAGQGWTVDSSVDNNQEVMDRSSTVGPERWREGVGCPAKAPCDDVEVLKQAFSENCTLDPSEKGKVCVSDPQDGGNKRERAASSSRHSIPQQSGNVCVCVCVCVVFEPSLGFFF